MRIAVVWPGAMGCLLSGRLVNAGIEVVLVDHRPARASRLQESGISVESPGGEVLRASPAVSTSVPADADLIIPCVRAYTTGQLTLPDNVPVLTLQNGLCNVDRLCSLIGSARVLAGATAEAADLVSEGHARHIRAGKTTIGTWTSCPVEPAVEALTAAGFETHVTESPGQMVWENQATHAGIDPLSAILNVPAVRLLEIPEARQLMRDLVVEATKTAGTEGYRFTHSLVEKTEDICKNSQDMVPRMARDVQSGHKTEVDEISGEILRRAQAAALPTPRTRVIWQMVKALERR